MLLFVAGSLSGSMVRVRVEPAGRSVLPVKIGLPEIAVVRVLMASTGPILSRLRVAVAVVVMPVSVTEALTVRLPST